MPNRLAGREQALRDMPPEPDITPDAKIKINRDWKPGSVVSQGYYDVGDVVEAEVHPDALNGMAFIEPDEDVYYSVLIVRSYDVVEFL